MQRPGPRQSRLRGQATILEGAELAEDVAALESAPDSEAGHPLRACGPDDPAADRNRSRPRVQLSGEKVDQRRLARAVGADQRVYLASLQLERYPVDGDQPAEVVRKAFRREQDLSHAVP